LQFGFFDVNDGMSDEPKPPSGNRNWKARIERGALFAFAFLVGPITLGLSAAVLLPHINAREVGRLCAIVTMLGVPVGFAIGMCTGNGLRSAVIAAFAVLAVLAFAFVLAALTAEKF
jgi:ABC-type multidrug transport system permease subunit